MQNGAKAGSIIILWEILAPGQKPFYQIRPLGAPLPHPPFKLKSQFVCQFFLPSFLQIFIGIQSMGPFVSL